LISIKWFLFVYLITAVSCLPRDVVCGSPLRIFDSYSWYGLMKFNLTKAINVWYCWGIVYLSVFLASSCLAGTEQPFGLNAVSWKLTPSLYNETKGHPASDVNLRGNVDDHVFWLGYYQRGSEFQQTRVGYERQFSLPIGKLVLSGQNASGGFWGGSSNLELSVSPESQFFGLLGLGRTNLKDYYNLNFDPNDAITVGGGYRSNPSTTLSAFQVRDDRLSTDQHVTHFVWRSQITKAQRWTVDFFHRSGRAEFGDPVYSGTGLSLTYDNMPWFVRLAWDPKASFTSSDMTRLAIGTRF
jgi:hypothetical protein